MLQRRIRALKGVIGKRRKRIQAERAGMAKYLIRSITAVLRATKVRGTCKLDKQIAKRSRQCVHTPCEPSFSPTRSHDAD